MSNLIYKPAVLVLWLESPKFLPSIMHKFLNIITIFGHLNRNKIDVVFYVGTEKTLDFLFHVDRIKHFYSMALEYNLLAQIETYGF